MTHSTEVCENHATENGLCDECDQRHAVQIRSRCTNCRHEMQALFPVILLNSPELLAFIGDHGHNFSNGHDWGWEWGEEILSVEPFEAKFTLTLDDEALSLTVDQELEVIDASRAHISTPD